MKAMLIVEIGDNDINDVLAEVSISNFYGEQIINYHNCQLKPIPEKIDIYIPTNLIKSLCIYNEEIEKVLEKK